MIGFIVKHSGFGLGKIHGLKNNQFTVLFCAPLSVKIVAATIENRPVLKRAFLPLNTLCDTQEGQCECRVIKTILAPNITEPHRYEIEFENGLSKEVSEIDLIPKEIPPVTSPLEGLAECQLEGYGTFLKREALVSALWSSFRGAFGLRALLSSRIDLRPHQAYVAGTVLMDRVPRYLLADEVGLGKTIEAGIVIHDILERLPAAKILILCPGTLTQQWLCELYSKFSGKVFHLLELRLKQAMTGKIPEKAIVAFTDALLHSPTLLKMKWDLVVVDEAHHLLAIPHLYRLAQQLSENAPSCLLLSAIPAQRREEEYLRLLALLEPQRYKPEANGAKEHFKQLYDRQIELGRKLSYISRRLGEFAVGTDTAELILQKIGELCSFPVVAQDVSLLASSKLLDPSDPTKFIEEVHALLHHVGDRYRISRRILRNRRSQLLDVEPHLRIDRELHRLGHQPDQLELDASNLTRRLVHSLHSSGVDDSVLLPLARQLFHSLCDPVCFSEFIALASSRNPVRADLLEFDGQISYQEWAEYASSLWTAANLQPQIKILEDLEHAAENWQSNAASSVRIDTLVTFLRNQHKEVPAKKFLIFAGFFGLGERLAQHLVDTFGKASVSQFTWDMETKAKEKAVMRFKRDSECWLMVSDETGGEGRNFQFVDELIHFDLPWHVSKIEQRIGRLDRLGREIPKVCSNVLYALVEEEDGWLNCLESGFQVFTRSISGLEFALSQLEGRIAQTAIAEGYEGLSLLVNDIKNGAEAERTEDDVQGMLDEASLDRTSAEVFRRAQSTPERDLALEEAFCDWFKFVTGNGALGFPPTGDLPDKCIVEFRPNQLTPGSIPLVTGPDGVQPDRVGTFRRKIAQERPDLEFFSVGNEFFDAVCTSLHQSTKGRTYAVECQSTHSPWRGFEFSYRPFGKRNLLLQHPGHQKHLDRVFAVRDEHFFIGENFELAADNSELLILRRSFTNETKDEVWKNFTLNNTRTQLLADRYANPGWEALVNRVEAKARIEAQRHFSLSLATILETESARIAEQIRQAKVARADDWEDEVGGLEALLKAIIEWDVELNTAGFLSVNGGIIQ
jgi:ATP-dependent helicase HepA